MEEMLEQVQARHRREQRDLQSRITNKKKNATKKTRKGVNDECAELERQLKERQEGELRRLNGEETGEAEQVGEGSGQSVNGLDPETAQLRNGDGVPPSSEDDELVAKLDAAQFSDHASSPAAAQAAQPKKRNRQKDRLARRAAEQEAATVAAEAEAANMVDYRGIESAYMTKEFKANSLVEKEIQPDGHCLFSAVADQLEQNGIPLATGAATAEPNVQPYKLVRRAAAGYMQAHPDDFLPFMEEPFDSYVSKIRDTAEWGGQLELLALANTYNAAIHVVQDGRTEVVRPAEATAGAELKKMWLAYYRHGYGLGEHYNSLRKAP